MPGMRPCASAIVGSTPKWIMREDGLARDVLERGDRDAVAGSRAAARGERLAEQIAYDYATSPFYRAKLDAAGVKPDQIRHVEDLARIPFMEKSEVADSQADGTLLGVNQCAPLDKIVRIQATGGTTGQPMRIGLTRRDIADYGEIGARALWAMGCRPGDIVFECMNYNLYSGGLSDHLTFETLGAATIPFGVGHTERLLTMMAGPHRPGRDLGDAVLRDPPRRGGRELGIEPRVGRPPAGLLLRRGRPAGPGLPREDRGHLGHGRARPVRDRRARAPFRRMRRPERRAFRRRRDRDRRADRPGHRRGPARSTTASRARWSTPRSVGRPAR